MAACRNIQPEGYYERRRRRMAADERVLERLGLHPERLNQQGLATPSSSGTNTGPIKFPFYQVPTPRGTFRFQRNRTNVQEAPGLTGDGIASWLLGYPGDSTITTQNFISSEKVAHAFYFQDDWQHQLEADDQPRRAL